MERAMDIEKGVCVETKTGEVLLVLEQNGEVLKCRKFLTIEDIFMCGNDGLPTMVRDPRELFLSDKTVEELARDISGYVEVFHVRPGRNPSDSCRYFFKKAYSKTGNTFRDFIPSKALKKPLKLTAADLYCGCGGLSFACIQGKIDPVVAVDKENSAARSYKQNHPGTKVHNMEVETFNLLLKKLNALEEERHQHTAEGCLPSQITEVRWHAGNIQFQVRGCRTWLAEEDVNEQDLVNFLRERENHGFPRKGSIGIVMGGTPCQSVTRMNLRAPTKNILAETRNHEINHFLEAVKIMQPRYVLLENVPDILTKDNGVYVKLATLELLQQDYQVRMGILAAGHYGAPQVRRRCFLWGAKAGQTLPSFPSPMFAMPDSDWREEHTNCSVRLHEELTRDLFPWVTLGDIMSDLPPSSNYATSGLYRYKCDPVTPMQCWLRREFGPPGCHSLNCQEGVSSRKKMVQDLAKSISECQNVGRMKLLEIEVGKAVIAEERRGVRHGGEVGEVPDTADVNQYFNTQLKKVQRKIGKEVIKAEWNQLDQAIPGEDLLSDHLPLKMSSLNFERVLQIDRKDGEALANGDGIIKRRRGFCGGYFHSPDCPSHQQKTYLDREVDGDRRVFEYSDMCESKGFFLSQRKYMIKGYHLQSKNSSFRRVDRRNTVGTLVGRCTPHMYATKGMLHHDEDRCLTVAECKRVQGFPDKYVLKGDLKSKFQQIGNAVSPHCAESLGYCLVYAIQQGGPQEFILDVRPLSKMCQELWQSELSFFNKQVEVMCLDLDTDSD